MKKLCVSVFVMIFGFTAVAQSNKSIVDFKSLVGTSYRSEKELTLLEGFNFRGGSMITMVDDPETLVANWFHKGSLAVVLFEQVVEDNAHKILDVLVVTNFGKNQEIKIGECREGDTDTIELVALVNSTDAERVKALKAWRFNRDKLRIETYSAALVTCLGMVGDN
jgi:hypothetical protein